MVHHTSVYTTELWYVLSCLWDGAYKISLAANQKVELQEATSIGFLFQ